MYTFNWALTAFRSESYIGSATALPDNYSARRALYIHLYSSNNNSDLLVHLYLLVQSHTLSKLI